MEGARARLIFFTSIFDESGPKILRLEVEVGTKTEDDNDKNKNTLLQYPSQSTSSIRQFP